MSRRQPRLSHPWLTLPRSSPKSPLLRLSHRCRSNLKKLAPSLSSPAVAAKRRSLRFARLACRHDPLVRRRAAPWPLPPAKDRLPRRARPLLLVRLVRLLVAPRLPPVDRSRRLRVVAFRCRPRVAPFRLLPVAASPWLVRHPPDPVVVPVALVRRAPVVRVPRSPVVLVVPVQVLVDPVVPVAVSPVARVVPVVVLPVVPVAQVAVPVAQRQAAVPVVRRAARADARTRSVVHPSVAARVDVVVAMS